MGHSKRSWTRRPFLCFSLLCEILGCDAQAVCAWGWLAAGTWSSAPPIFPCGAVCARVPFANASLPFRLHRCVGDRSWQFSFDDDASQLVMCPAPGVLRSCLDVVEDGTRLGLHLASRSQRWRLQGTKLRNDCDVFLMAPDFDFDGPVVVGELNHTAGWSDWTFVPSSSLGDGTSKPLLLSSPRANLVQNDQFLEKCGELQAEGVPEDITLVCPWTILGDSTSIIRNPHHGWNVVLGAISQTVPTYSGLPHTLKFNVKIYGNCDPGAAILVSLLPSSSESNVFHTHSNDGLWTAEELRFSAVGETVNLTFANIGSVRSNCSVAISNVEVGLEDDYLVFMAAYKLWTRVLPLYALVSIFGVLAFAILVMHIVSSLRTRKLK